MSHTEEEHFGSPSAAFSLDQFDQSRQTTKAELSRKSLYVAFDPLVNTYANVGLPSGIIILIYVFFPSQAYDRSHFTYATRNTQGGFVAT
jgi:hypothetical protein